MSDISKIVPKTETGVIKDRTLSELPFLAEVEIEQELNERHTRFIVATTGVKTLAEKSVVASEARLMLAKERPFRAWQEAPLLPGEVLPEGMAYKPGAFEVAVYDDETLVPFLAWLMMRPAHPLLSRADAEALVTRDNFYAVQAAVRRLLGFQPVVKREEPATGEASGDAGEPNSPTTTPSQSPSSPAAAA